MKFKRKLGVRLSNAEIVIRNDQLMRSLDRIEELKGDAKKIADDYKDKIGGESDRVTELRNVLRSHQEQREVDCLKVKWLEGKCYVTIRIDTGEEVNREPLEVQTTIFDIDEERAQSDAKMKAANDDTETVPEISDEDRAKALLSLGALLRKVDVSLYMRQLWRLTVGEIEEARAWAQATLKAMEDGEPVPERPVWLDEAAGKTLDQIEDEARAEALIGLLKLARVEVTLAQVLEWEDGDRTAAAEWAGATHARSLGYDKVEVPQRPAFLPEPAPEETPANDEAGAEGNSDTGADAKTSPAPDSVPETRSEAVSVTVERLRRIGIVVDAATVEAWTDEELFAAGNWAEYVWMQSQGEDVTVGERPAFLPAENLEEENRVMKEYAKEQAAAVEMIGATPRPAFELSTQNALADLGIEMPLKTIQKWNRKQLIDAKSWAELFYLNAHPEKGIAVTKVPKRPKFIPVPPPVPAPDAPFGDVDEVHDDEVHDEEDGDQTDG